MSSLALFLSQHELLLLVLVLLFGVLLGRVELLGVRLGPAGVLFAGLFLSAWLSPSAPLRVAPALKDLGLVLFVYCVGLTSGPGFFSALRSRGARLNLTVLAALSAGALLTVFAGRLLGLDRGQIAGVYCGALTNTPALAAASDRLKDTAFADHAVLGYSVAYPFGVLGVLILLRVLARLRQRALKEEREHLSSTAVNKLLSRDLKVSNAQICGKTLGELRVRDEVGVVLSRLQREGSPTFVPTSSTRLESGDVVVAVGSKEALDTATHFFGGLSSERLEARREQVDMRRILVSRTELVGRSLGELDLEERFNAQITRLRRADLDILPSPGLRLERGDRLRVVAPVERLPELAKYFGDSDRALAEIDFIALALGLSLGLLLAQLPLPFPGGSVELGNAGGPLLVSLVLGRLGRSGSLQWSLPYETSNVLRDLGLLLFLAGVGIDSGGALHGVIGQSGLGMLLLGALVTLATHVLALLLLHTFCRAGVIESMGACSGSQTQPATLAAAYELSGRSEQTYVAYAIVYPVAMIAKILLAQLIALLA